MTSISQIDLAKKLSTVDPIHYGMNYRNQVLNWLPTDTEESYQAMMKESQHRAYFEQQGWDQPGAITYRINSEGFRGSEFASEGSLLTLGCSFTIGIGLPESAVWPYLLATELAFPVANLAWGGISADTCTRLAAFYIPRLRPRLVVMLTPPLDRMEIWLDKQYCKSQPTQPWPAETIMPQSKISEFANDQFIKHWYLNETNSEINRLKNQLAVKQICEMHNIPCLIYCAFNAFGRSREEVGYARDYMHAGPKGHKMLVEAILDDWNEIKHT